MTGTGRTFERLLGPVRTVRAEPVCFQECPKCGFPLNVYFVDFGSGGEPRKDAIDVHVACARCMWSENWGSLKTPKGAHDGEPADSAAR